jgi:hypothetical protein
LMQMCWKKQPQQRPVSSSLFCLFFLVSHTNTHKHTDIESFP